MYAQPVNNKVKDVVLPAPNAGALGKYGDIPVSYFTGTTNVSIPLYTVQCGPLSLPLSLSYHTSGIKVGETASWAGLGWSLNVGGIITRTVQGRPDDQTNGYYTLNGVPGNAQELGDGTKDGEPDIFSYNVHGIAGKFFIDKFHNVQMIPKSDIKIKLLYNGTDQGRFEQFTLINTDGTRYVFGASDPELSDSGRDISTFDDPTVSYVTTWYLKKIVSYDYAYTIDFTYAEENYSYKSPGSTSYEMTTCGGGTSQGASGYSQGITGYPYHYYNIVNMKGRRLSKITTSDGRTQVDVFMGADRLDLETNPNATANHAQIIDRIEVSSTAAYCTSFKFTFGYFSSTDFPSWPEGKRLRLDKIQEYGCSNSSITKAPYTFTYDQGALVNRLSNVTDHWGFYNGQGGNEGQMPNIPLPASISTEATSRRAALTGRPARTAR